MANKNDARKRIEEDFAPLFPVDDIKCKDCAFRKPDLVQNDRIIVKGYKNGYCKVYTPEISKGKPNDILFQSANCKYYAKEEKDTG